MLRDEAIALLGRKGIGAAELWPGLSIPVLNITVAPWRGARTGSLTDDCRKGGSLLAAADGTMSCLEVEVVRRLRAHPGWEVGWVQGFACGRRRWGEEISLVLPPTLEDRNARVQLARGGRRASFSGHPDVGLTDGRRVAYLECKVRDSLKPSQLDWLQVALAGRIVSPQDLVIVQGVLDL